MSRYDDINPMDIDPETNRPYAGYSSPSLDTSFHDAEMDVDDAPDLLAELEYVLQAHDYDGALTIGTASLSPAIADRLRRAIAKAKGGAA